MDSHDGATFSHKAGQNSAVCREADARGDHTTSKITQPQRGKYGMLFTHLWISNFTEIHKITDVWNTGKYKPECKDEWTQWELRRREGWEGVKVAKIQAVLVWKHFLSPSVLMRSGHFAETQWESDHGSELQPFHLLPSRACLPYVLKGSHA